MDKNSYRNLGKTVCCSAAYKRGGLKIQTRPRRRRAIRNSPQYRRPRAAHSARPSLQAVKRVLDIVLALCLLIFLFPLYLVLGFAVAAGSPGPIFYGHTRLGRGGRVFRAWKFRTMVCHADALLQQCLAADAKLREEWLLNRKLKCDPRITGIGRLLRVSSLDELPQVWNVLVGEMSLVGPRPIVLPEVARYGEHYPSYQSVRPGITGLWQVSGRNCLPYENRVLLDRFYVENHSMILDIRILLRTLKVVLAGNGAY